MLQRLRSLVSSGAVVVTAIAALGGCGGKAPAPAADVYTVRGVVERLPQGAGPDRSVYIHHESIPDFRDVHGEAVGMASMTMPFPLAAGVSLADIAPGDPVEFTFTVTWKPRTGYTITRIQKLPAGTVIDFPSQG